MCLCKLEISQTFGTRDGGMGPRVHLVYAGLADSVPTWKGQWDPLTSVIFYRADVALGDQVTSNFFLHLLNYILSPRKQCL